MARSDSYFNESIPSQFIQQQTNNYYNYHYYKEPYEGMSLWQ